MTIHRIARQFFGRPLLLERSSALTISNFLLTRLGGNMISGEDDAGESIQFFESSSRSDGSREAHRPRASRFYGEYPVDPDANGRPKPYRRTPEGTAIITMVGELVNRGAYVGASSGLISYEGFKYQMLTAARDDRVRQIVLDIESPGGEATGCFEAAEVVRKCAEVKPVFSVANGMACSAAFALACSATRSIILPTALDGSIGVVMVHLDFEKYLANEGVKPTLIFSGDHKVDGNPYEALPKEVREDFQRESDSFMSDFVATVVAGRKNLTEKQVRDTQARVFKGREAVDVGLADDVGTFEDLLDELQRNPASGGSKPKGTIMKTFTQDEHDAALASARTEAHTRGVTEGKTAGAKEASERFSAILASDKVKGKEVAAIDLAMKSPQMSAEDVIAFVDKNIAAGAKVASIEQRMNGQGSALSLGAPSSPPTAAGGWGKVTEAANRRRGFAG